MTNPTPAPEPAKLLSEERLDQLRVRNDMAAPDGLRSHDVRDIFAHISALEQLAARPSPEVAELVAAAADMLGDWECTLGIALPGSASWRLSAALAAIQKGGTQRAERTCPYCECPDHYRRQDGTFMCCSCAMEWTAKEPTDA